MEQVKEEIACHRCGRIFNTGERVYPARIWILGRNLCLLCKDAVVSFIDTHPKNPALKPITHMTI